MKTYAIFTALLFTFGAITIGKAQQATGGRPNLLTNAAFEDGLNGWKATSHQNLGTATVDTEEKFSGKSSLRIVNSGGSDTFLKQVVTVKPKTRYRLSGYIKTKDVVVKGAGATLSLGGGYERSKPIDGTNTWSKVELEFDSGAASTVEVGPRLGHWYSLASGTAWFVQLSMVELGPSRKR